MGQLQSSQQLFDFAYIPKYEDAFQALAKMADHEEWDFSDARKKSAHLQSSVSHYPKIMHSLNIKNGRSDTPLN